MSSKKIIATICILILMLPSMAIAQTAAQEAGDPKIVAPTLGGGSTGTTTLLVNVFSETNNRFLGDVKISFLRYPQSSEYTPELIQNPVTTPDPPKPGGYKIENVRTRQYELIAERKGYKVYNELLNLTSDKRFTEVSIKMSPLTGTPTVKESDLAYNQNSGSNYLASRYVPSVSQYPYYSNNPYNPQSSGGVYNPYSNYPNNGWYGYDQTNSQYGAGYEQGGYPYPYSENGVGPFGNGQFPYEYTYNTSSNESFFIPVVVNINQSNQYNNINELNVEIVDVAYAENIYSPNHSAMNNKITLTPQSASSSFNNPFGQTQSLYGCLQANRTYQVVVRQGYNYSSYQIPTSQPVTTKFTTSSGGEAVKISVYPPSSYTSRIQIRTENVPQNMLSNSPFRCPTGYNQTGMTGPTVFSDSQIYFDNLKDYTIQRMPQNGWYYLVNKSNPLDFRQLKFVDRGDGKGGLVFFSSVQTPYNQQPPSSSHWYFTGYTRNNNDDVKFTPEVFTKTPMTPDQYRRVVNQKIIDTFNDIPNEPS